MKIRVLAVGTKMPHWVYDGVAEYVKRLPKDFSLEFVELPAGQRTKNSDLKRIMKTEGQAILAAKAITTEQAELVHKVVTEYLSDELLAALSNYDQEVIQNLLVLVKISYIQLRTMFNTSLFGLQFFQ